MATAVGAGGVECCFKGAACFEGAACFGLTAAGPFPAASSRTTGLIGGVIRMGAAASGVGVTVGAGCVANGLAGAAFTGAGGSVGGDADMSCARAGPLKAMAAAIANNAGLRGE